MTNLVEFPGLGLSFEISRVAFTVFGIPIYWYGVLIGIGMLLALAMAFRNAGRFGIDTDRMIDVIFIGFFLAIIFGRLYYVLFVDARYRTFFELIDLRSGGIAIYGGIIGAFLGAAIGCKWRKVPLLPMLDLTSMGFLIGQAIGRWGNFFNQEAFGTNTTSVFGMISPATTNYLWYNREWLQSNGLYVDPYMPVHPTFLYESVWCAVGFLLLYLYSKRRRFNGEVTLLYVMWYGAGRFFIEGLRTDSLMIGPLRVSQVLAAASALVAFAVWLAARRKTRGKPLVVPALPPRTAKVTVEGESGPQEVEIVWPASQKPPTKDERQALALEALAAAKEVLAGEDAKKQPGDKLQAVPKAEGPALKDEQDDAPTDAEPKDKAPAAPAPKKPDAAEEPDEENADD